MPPQQQDRQPGHEHEMSPAPDFSPRFTGSGRLDGKVALIGGGDSGIGRAIAVLFAREGADIAILNKEEDRDARLTEEKVVMEGRRCLLIPGDVGDEEVCLQAVDQTIAAYGHLDILINNAAEQHPQDDPTEISGEQLERTFRTNTYSCFYMVKAALPHLESGAAIINTTSVTAYRGSHHLIDYAATKGAIVAFTRSLSSALVGRGIRVNAVAPGPIWTPLIPASFEAEKVAHFGENVPMGRPGQPNEVASCHLFLACDDSSYMTGHVLHPNGGELIGG
jgi:NAD(P)-dependent dehydrogenase (short-subunit alcohol dehydrogenase family)